MLAIFTTIWSFMSGPFTALAGKVMDWKLAQSNVDLEGFKTATGIDSAAYTAWLNASVEVARIKAAANAWWGAKAIVMIAGAPCALHMAAVMLDSMPFWGHVVGSWGVPKPPAPYDQYQRDIVMSFFIVAPAMPLISAASQWLGRKK